MDVLSSSNRLFMTLIRPTKPIKFNELKNDVDLIHSTTGYFAFSISLKPAPDRAGFGFLS